MARRGYAARLNNKQYKEYQKARRAYNKEKRIREHYGDFRCVNFYDFWDSINKKYIPPKTEKEDKEVYDSLFSDDEFSRLFSGDFNIDDKSIGVRKEQNEESDEESDYDLDDEAIYEEFERIRKQGEKTYNEMLERKREEDEASWEEYWNESGGNDD